MSPSHAGRYLDSAGTMYRDNRGPKKEPSQWLSEPAHLLGLLTRHVVSQDDILDPSPLSSTAPSRVYDYRDDKLCSCGFSFLLTTSCLLRQVVLDEGQGDGCPFPSDADLEALERALASTIRTRSVVCVVRKLSLPTRSQPLKSSTQPRSCAGAG